MEDVGADDIDEREELPRDDREFWVVAFGENVVALAAIDGLFPNALPPNAFPPKADPEIISLGSEAKDCPDGGNAELVLVVALNVLAMADLNPDVWANALGPEELKTESVGPVELKAELV